MSDRELLELAAKAAGMTIHAANQAQRDACGDGDVGLWISNDTTCWNPLTDGSDALRLAVGLGLEIEFGSNFVNVGKSDSNKEWHLAREEFGDDPLAATRRAIVRAAAEIGKAQYTT